MMLTGIDIAGMAAYLVRRANTMSDELSYYNELDRTKPFRTTVVYFDCFEMCREKLRIHGPMTVGDARRLLDIAKEICGLLGARACAR